MCFCCSKFFLIFFTAAADAYDIGRLAFTDGRYDITIGWMKEALSLASNESEDEPNKVDVLDHLAWSEFKV